MTPDSPGEDPGATDLDLSVIAAACGPRTVGCRLQVLGRVGSTMDAAAEAVRAGCPDGTVILADHQLAGRGRFGREWVAPPGRALLLSIVFRSMPQADRAGQLPMAVGLGALGALGRLWRACAGPALKWPNDLVAGEAKLGGLLAEGAVSGKRMQHAVVGLGLNVHQDADELPPGATSLRLLGQSVRRDRLAAAILVAIDELYARLRSGEDLVEEWAANLTTLGRRVTARGPTGTVAGRAIGVSPDGGLLLEDEEGRTIVVHAGDVTLDAEAP